MVAKYTFGNACFDFDVTFGMLPSGTPSRSKNPAFTPLSQQESPYRLPGAMDFIRRQILDDVAMGRYPRIHTRFPPEPNGYLHIGHAKAILLNFGIAKEFGGVCNLRYDDTNPTKEKTEYVDSILRDVEWLLSGDSEVRLGLKPVGATPADVQLDGREDSFLPAVTREIESSPNRPIETGESLEPFYASDYFEQMYQYAVALIKRGSAYVCDLSQQEIAMRRGVPPKPGRNSPFRSRSVVENLELFAQMRSGRFPEGEKTLRAKIDMTSSNMWLRDPVLYRIRRAEHHRTAGSWAIYPMYDFAHCLSDYLEGITHSICTLEFEAHRSLYDWILSELRLPRTLPSRIAFARFNLTYTVMSKRKLMRLVEEGVASGWDDPRMPTLRGFRRRGVPASTIRRFITGLSVTKFNGQTQIEALEHAIRKDLNRTASRKFVVLRPLEVVVTN